MRTTRSYSILWLIAGLVATGVTGVAAQPMYPASVDLNSDIYYTVAPKATLYHASDSTRPYLHLRLREPVFMLGSQNGWARVRTADGARGLVRAEHLSNVWLRISKSKKTLYVYRGSKLLTKYPTDLGYNFFSDKERRGSRAEPDQWRTPNGEFFVVRKNPRSSFYKALVLNYPNAEDADRGRSEGLISDDEYEAILQAHETFSMPPMDTQLGGWIEIHGDGTGRRSNWTQGCIAIRNSEIDRIWSLVEIGTPVLIEP